MSELSDDLIKMLVSERRVTRWWGILRSALWLMVAIVFLYWLFSPTHDLSDQAAARGPYVALVRLNGVIMPGASFSAYKVLPRLRKAFKNPNAKGVILQINSPGGSPVQAQIIHDAILQLKSQYHKKVVVIGQDALASGAYLVATAADKIVVHRDTITGSIGVIMSGFGFTDAIQKLGITRRVFTAGTNKDRMDPFKPLTSEDTAKVKQILAEVHQDFIADVEQGRKGRLQGDPALLFSGDFWTGTTAVKLGIADETSTLWQVMQNDFGVTHFRDYSARPSLVETLFKGAETMLGFHLENEAAPLKAQLPDSI